MTSELPPISEQPEIIQILVAELEDIARHLVATKYLTVVGMVILVCEIATFMPTEIRVVWRAERSLAKYLFLLHRYVTVLGLFAVLQAFSGFTRMNTPICHFLFYFFAVVATLSVGFADALVTIEVYELWDRSKVAMVFVTSAFFITYGAACVSMGISISRTIKHVTWQPYLNSCLVAFAPRLTAVVWGCGLLFEVSVFLSTLWNVFDKPRPKNTKLTTVLIRDGLLYFVGIILLRIFNIAMSLRAPEDLFWVALFFVWSMITVLVNRLMMNQFISRYVRLSARRFGKGAKLPLPVTTIETEVFEMREPAQEDPFKMPPTRPHPAVDILSYSADSESMVHPFAR